MGFERLQDLLPHAAARRNLSGRLQNAHVFHVYLNCIYDLFGEELLLKTKARSLKGKALWVTASSSVVAQEIHMKSQEILAFIASHVPGSGVQELRVVQESELMMNGEGALSG